MNKTNYLVPSVKWPRGYMSAGTFDFSGTGGSNRSITFDLNQAFQDIASEARTDKKRAYVHHFVWNFIVEHTTVIGVGNTSTTFKQLEAIMNIKTNVPAIPSSYYQNETNFSYVDIDTRRLNPDCYRYLDELDVGTSQYPNQYADDSYGTSPAIIAYGSFLHNGKPNQEGIDTWGCASKFISTVQGGAMVFSDTFSVPMPVCRKSGFLGRDPIKTDRLPLELFASSNSKALFNLSYIGGITPLEVLTVDTGAPATCKVTVELLAYIDYDDENDDLFHGVTWQNEAIAMGLTGNTVAADYYDMIAIYPEIIKYADNCGANVGMPNLYFKPFDFAPILWDGNASKIQWNINAENVYPGKARPYFRRIVEDFNRCAVDGASYSKLYFKREVSNLFVSSISALSGPTVEVNYNFAYTAGYMTNFPFLPLALTDPMRRSFGPGFMSKPGSQVEMLIQLTGMALTSDMIKYCRKLTLGGSQNAVPQEEKIRNYEQFGRDIQSTAKWRTCLDGGASPRAALFEAVVPSTARVA